MIPLFLVLKLRGWARSLWLPLFLVWLLLLPFVVILLPIIAGCCHYYEIDFKQLVAALWQALASVRGTHLEISDRNQHILIHIY